MEQGRGNDKKGYAKIKNCCSVARDNGYKHVWIDTCCIDKTSSAELTEAINSMYRYYREAEVCYSFLSDTSSSSDFSQSRWFTRGWTLQELIAPARMIFFDKDWQQLGTRESLGDKISERTSIPQAILSGTQNLESASIAQRMSWAAGRQTTKIEDRAYSLMGIFGINMPLLYGEGQKAFVRLQEEILRVSDDHSIFAWRHNGTHDNGGLLAGTPDAFKGSKNIISWNPLTPYNSPFTVTNKGVHLDAPFIAQAEGGLGLVVLHCAEAGTKDRLIGIYLRDPFLTMEHFERCRSEELTLVNLREFSPSQYPTRNLCIRLQGKGPSQIQGSAVSKDQEQRLRHSTEGEKNLATDGAEHAQNDEQEKDPQQRLSLAASEGNLAVVKELLAFPTTDADSMSEGKRTPLSLAAEAGHEHIINLLLNRREVNINSRDKHGLSPLSYAAALGHEKVVWILLARSDIVSSSQDVWKRTFISLAARRGHTSLVGQLLARKDTQGHLVDGGSRSVLSHAAETGQEEVARLILGSGKVHPDLRDQAGRSALWYASKNGHTGLVKLLLETGWVDPTSKDDESSTTVWQAASNGHGPVVELLLADHADFEVKGEHGRTPLCQASTNGHTDVVKGLLNSNADTEAKDKDGATALWHAATRGYEVIVKMLLQSGADPNARGADRQTGLWHACQKGYDAVARLLLEKRADPDVADERPKRTDYYTRTPVYGSQSQPALWHAASRGDHVIVQLLLENHATSVDKYGILIGLDEAAKSGHHAVIKTYLEKCTRGQRWDGQLLSAISSAIDGKQAASVETLIKSLGDAGALRRSIHSFGLLRTVLLGDGDTARLLLDNGVDVNEPCDAIDTLRTAAKKRCRAIADIMAGTWGARVIEAWNDEMDNDRSGQELKNRALGIMPEGYSPTVLWCAVVRGDEALVEILLQHGADTEAKIKEGKTVLFYAISLGHDSIVKLLLKHGANVEALDVNGKSPLAYAVSEYAAQKNRIPELLLDQGADMEAKNKYGDTLLMRGGLDLATAELLVARGADVNARNKYGVTPLMTAARFKGNVDIVRLFLEHGADPTAKDGRGQTAASEAQDKAVLSLLREHPERK